MILFFDAMFSPSFVQTLRDVVRNYPDPNLRLMHIYDRFSNNVKDEDWIPEIAGSDNIIVSGDLGRGSGVKLPAVCKLYKITHILMSPTLQNTRPFNKIRAIIYVWPDIIRAFNSPKGTRFQIVSVGAMYEKFRFVEKTT